MPMLRTCVNCSDHPGCSRHEKPKMYTHSQRARDYASTLTQPLAALAPQERICEGALHRASFYQFACWHLQVLEAQNGVEHLQSETTRHGHELAQRTGNGAQASTSGRSSEPEGEILMELDNAYKAFGSKKILQACSTSHHLLLHSTCSSLEMHPAVGIC